MIPNSQLKQLATRRPIYHSSQVQSVEGCGFPIEISSGSLTGTGTENEARQSPYQNNIHCHIGQTSLAFY